MPTQQKDAPRSLTFHGSLVDGLGEGQRFTAIDWVRQRFRDLLGIDPYPGTVNLRVTAKGGVTTLAHLRAAPGITIPPEPGFCAATAYHATLQGPGGQSVSAAIVVPHVPDYPADKVELVAAVNVRETLGVKAGDHLTIHVHL